MNQNLKKKERCKMSVYENIYKLVNRIGTTPEVYKKEIPIIINNMLYNKLDIDVTNCKMISGNINKNTVVYIIFCDSYINLKEPILERILTIDNDKDNYILLVQDNIIDLDIEIKTITILSIYGLLNTIVTRDIDNKLDIQLTRCISVILTILSLYGIYKNKEEFKSFISGFIKENNLDELVDDIFESLELDVNYPRTNECIIESMINNYELYRFIKKKEDR